MSLTDDDTENVDSAGRIGEAYREEKRTERKKRIA